MHSVRFMKFIDKAAESCATDRETVATVTMTATLYTMQTFFIAIPLQINNFCGTFQLSLEFMQFEMIWKKIHTILLLAHANRIMSAWVSFMTETLSNITIQFRWINIHMHYTCFIDITQHHHSVCLSIILCTCLRHSSELYANWTESNGEKEQQWRQEEGK